MKNSINGTNKGSTVRAMILGIVSGFLLGLLLLMIFALIISSAGLGSAFIKVASVIILGGSAFICGIVAAKKAEEKKLIIGFLTGILFYLVVAVISMAVTKNTFTTAFLLRMMICAVASGVGALIVTLRSSNKRYI